MVGGDGNIVYLAKVNPDNGLELKCSCGDGFPPPSFKWSEPLHNYTTKKCQPNRYVNHYHPGGHWSFGQNMKALWLKKGLNNLKRTYAYFFDKNIAQLTFGND